MWTSNSGLPFNQPSKSSTKWACVRYRPGPEEALKRQLVLAERRSIELALHMGAERRVAQRECKGPCQQLGATGGGEDPALFGAAGGRARWPVGTGERSHGQRERRHA